MINLRNRRAFSAADARVGASPPAVDSLPEMRESDPEVRSQLRAAALDGPRRHRHSFRGSFSAGSTPIFACRYAFCSIFQDLQENHLLASKFAKNDSKFLRIFLLLFCKMSLKDLEHLQNVTKKLRNFRFLQIIYFAKFCGTFLKNSVTLQNFVKFEKC